MNHYIPLLSTGAIHRKLVFFYSVKTGDSINRLLVLLLVAFNVLPGFGQRNDETDPLVYFSAHVLGAQTEVAGLPETIIPTYFNPSTYQIEERKVYAFGGGFGLKVNLPESNFFFRGDLNFLFRQRSNEYLGGGDYHYSDVDNLEYRIWLDYHRVSLAAQGGFHFVGHDEESLLSFYVSIGGAFSPMLRRRVNYHTNRPDNLNHDLKMQAELERYLLLRNDLALLGTLGFEIGSGENKLDVNIQYQLGVSDIVETLGGDHELIEYPGNKTIFIQITLGYLFKWQR